MIIRAFLTIVMAVLGAGFIAWWLYITALGICKFFNKNKQNNENSQTNENK